MSKGFFTGVLCGLVLGGAGLAAVSLVAPFPGPLIPSHDQTAEVDPAPAEPAISAGTPTEPVPVDRSEQAELQAESAPALPEARPESAPVLPVVDAAEAAAETRVEPDLAEALGPAPQVAGAVLPEDAAEVTTAAPEPSDEDENIAEMAEGVAPEAPALTVVETQDAAGLPVVDPTPSAGLVAETVPVTEEGPESGTDPQPVAAEGGTSPVPALSQDDAVVAGDDASRRSGEESEPAPQVSDAVVPPTQAEPATLTVAGATATPAVVASEAQSAPLPEGQSPAVPAGEPPQALVMAQADAVLETPAGTLDEAPKPPMAEPPAPEVQLREERPEPFATAPGDIAPEVSQNLPLPPLTPKEQALVDAAEGLPEVRRPASDEAAGQPALPGVPPLLREQEGVTSDRLPQVGDIPAAAKTVEIPANPAYIRYARAFGNPQGKPVFAILLMDVGGSEAERQAAAELPFPVSFVIDPAAGDAERAAETYRKAGQEVVMLAAGLPQDATPVDLEVAFEMHAQVLPEAVAVLVSQTADDLREDDLLTQQMLAAVKGQGRGILSWERGLNTMVQMARRDGVPSASVFRVLDNGEETALTITRYLDRAAFKAAQDGRVTVLGSASPETVAVLREWVGESRADSVALAPVSAVLQDK